MLVTAIIATVIVLVAKFFAARYLVSGRSSWFIGGTAGVIYALGVATYPIYFEPSYLAVVPVTLPASGPDLSHRVSCAGETGVAKETTPGAIDAASVGATPSAPVSGTLTVPRGGVLHLRGWIVSASGPARSVCAILDGKIVDADIIYGIQRNDVAVALNNPKDVPSGYEMSVKVGNQPGSHTLTVGSVGSDGRTADPLTVAPLSFHVP